MRLYTAHQSRIVRTRSEFLYSEYIQTGYDTFTASLALQQVSLKISYLSESIPPNVFFTFFFPLLFLQNSFGKC